MKRAQITIFIVLGIFILIIWGLVFFVSKQTSDIVMGGEVNKIYSDFLGSTDIKYMTQNCLDRITKEALLLVGLQGGRIYDYQINNGYAIENFYDVIPFNYTERYPEGVIYNVSYGIKAPTDLPYPNPPGYPYPGSLVRDASRSSINWFFENRNDQLFADVPKKNQFTILADLCSRFGPNNPDLEGAEITCETYSLTGESIQEYIQQYIEQNIEDCINFTLKKTLQYTISLGKASMEVLIGENDLLVSLKYPIEISIKNKPPITRHLNFNMRSNVRLKKLHEIASHLIGYDPYTIPTMADSNNILFNMENDDPSDCYKGTDSCIVEGITVSKLRDYCLNNDHCDFNNEHYDYSDILIIEDSRSIINGRPYRFQFAIENRRPTLDLIDENVSSDEYYYWYIEETYGESLTDVYNKPSYQASDDYNIVVDKNSDLKIFPLGIDPDGDDLTYRYTKWSKNDFEGSTYYLNGVPARKYVTGFASDHNIAKDAKVKASGSGTKTVTITVKDNEGLTDYQDVKIRVI